MDDSRTFALRRQGTQLRRVALRALLCTTALGTVFLASGALASTPNLSGDWHNPADPASAPPWVIQVSSDLSTLTMTWGGYDGHSDLHGTFHGTLDSGGNAYSGTTHVTEASVVVDGTMTLRIVSADDLAVSYAANGGSQQGWTLRRQAIKFSFRGYANDVKVVPPLVGRFQLGKSHIQGSGTFAGSSIQGAITDLFEPKYAQYPVAHLSAEVIGYSYHRAAHATSRRLTMTIAVMQTDAAKCAVGDQGTLTLYQSASRLSNHQNSDSVMVHWHGGRCPTFEQGWTNADGGQKTSPHYGGPPHGGEWAIVKISP